MDKNFQTLLRLDGLILTRKGLEFAGNNLRKGCFDDFYEEIEKLRRALPPLVMSLYDRLARRYADPLSMLTGNVCHGCQRRISKRVALLVVQFHEVFQCEHCDRLVFAKTHSPDYVT